MESTAKSSDRLNVIWSSADREVALKMVFMYTLNAKRLEWWEEIRLVIWGPSAPLLCQDAELQAVLAEIRDAGVELTACKACSDGYGVSDQLESLGVAVQYMGQPLTEMLKENEKVITF